MTQQEHVHRIAVKMANKHGLINLSRVQLCEAAGIPDGSFPHIMGMTFNELIESLRKVDDSCIPKGVVTKNRVNPDLRKDQILKIAIAVARKYGCHKTTRDEIAHRAGVSMGLVSHYFGTMKKLRRTIMRAAIVNEELEIIAKGLANNDPYARKASDDLKQRAVSTLV
jgi:hypothetical protein